MINPTISVILCAYNAEPYIYQALYSISEQTYKNIELIIIDDGSTDNTSDAIYRFISECKCLSVKFIKQDNIGLTKSLNKAIQISNGHYIARMDADDISFPERLEQSMKYLLSHDLDMVTTKAYRFIGESVIDQVPRINKNLINVNFELMKFGNPFVHGSFLVKRDVFSSVMYDELYPTAQDFEFICNILKHGYRLGYLNMTLYKVRIEPNSLGRKKNSSQARNALAIARKYFGTDVFMIIKYHGFVRRLFSLLKRLYV